MQVNHIFSHSPHADPWWPIRSFIASFNEHGVKHVKLGHTTKAQSKKPGHAAYGEGTSQLLRLCAPWKGTARTIIAFSQIFSCTIFTWWEWWKQLQRSTQRNSSFNGHLVVDLALHQIEEVTSYFSQLSRLACNRERVDNSYMVAQNIWNHFWYMCCWCFLSLQVWNR